MSLSRLLLGAALCVAPMAFGELKVAPRTVSQPAVTSAPVVIQAPAVSQAPAPQVLQVQELCTDAGCATCGSDGNGFTSFVAVPAPPERIEDIPTTRVDEAR